MTFRKSILCIALSCTAFSALASECLDNATQKLNACIATGEGVSSCQLAFKYARSECDYLESKYRDELDNWNASLNRCRINYESCVNSAEFYKSIPIIGMWVYQAEKSKCDTQLNQCMRDLGPRPVRP